MPPRPEDAEGGDDPLRGVGSPEADSITLLDAERDRCRDRPTERSHRIRAYVHLRSPSIRAVAGPKISALASAIAGMFASAKSGFSSTAPLFLWLGPGAAAAEPSRVGASVRHA